MGKGRVVLCSKCGATTTEDDAFQLETRGPDGSTEAVKWICKECLLIQEAVSGLVAEGRVFNTGATRDTNADKLAYDKGMSMQVLQAYMEYLGKHRVQKNGSLRDWDNWKQGIPPEVYRESMMRHTIDAVRKSKGLSLREEMPLKDLLSAVIFNASGWLFELLVEESGNREIDNG